MKSKMIETQKHQQSFEALGLFQIDFGLIISEMFLSNAHRVKACLIRETVRAMTAMCSFNL